MARFQFPLQSYKDESLQFDAQRLVNMYMVPGQSSSISPYKLISTPGTKYFTEIDTEVSNEFCRSLETFNGRTFTVYGNKFYEIESDGNIIERGTLSTNDTSISMDANLDVVCIIDGVDGYFFNLTTNSFDIITDSTFVSDVSSCKSVVYINGYFYFGAIPNSFIFYQSKLDASDPTDMLDANFGGADTDASPITKLIVRGKDLIIFKEQSIEFWQITGRFEFAAERTSYTLSDIGTKYADTVTRIIDRVSFLGSSIGSENSIYTLDGYNLTQISTYPITSEIGNDVLDDVTSFTYQEDAMYFYVLSIPSLNKTFVYEYTTGQWHERSSLQPNGTQGRYNVSYSTFNFNKTLIADYQSSIIFDLNRDYLTEAGGYITRIATFPHINNELKNMILSQVTFNIRTGQKERKLTTQDVFYFLSNEGDVLTLESKDRFLTTTGTFTVSGDAPVTNGSNQIKLDVSKDGGRTWSQPRYRDLGDLGEYDTLVRYLGFGVARDFVLRVESTSPTIQEWFVAAIELTSMGR